MRKSMLAVLTALLLVIGFSRGVTALQHDNSVRYAPEIKLATGELIQISPSGSCAINGDLEGVFVKAAMAAYTQCIVPLVDGWIDSVYTSMPHPGAYYFVPSGVSGNVGGPNGCPYNDRSLAYCKLDANIYLGSEAVWEQYSVYGDAAPPTIVAHEVSHHFQNMLKMAWATTPNDQVRYEKQADCGAGAFMAYSRNNGWMARDDIVDLAGSLRAAGQADGPNRSHGTEMERVTSFDMAYMSRQAQPLFECNSFVLEVALIAP